jgi:hypothetical protein
MSNPNPDLDTEINDNPHKLTIKHKIRMIKTQVDWYAKILDFLDLKANPNLIQFNYLISEIT